MISLKAIAGGVTIAGALSLAPLGLGVANAEPSPIPPQVTSVHDAGHGGGQAPSTAAPSPYAIYGGSSVCGMPGLYFVNICE